VSATAIAEYVSAHPGRTIAQIANAVGRDPVAVSAALNEALRAGLVEVNRSRWERPRSRA
jgi:predicted transcriptional regulator